MYSFRSLLSSRRLGSAVVAAALALPVVVVTTRSDAAPAHDRAFHGYDSVGTNGFGSTESWAGNLRLFAGPDQSGEVLVAYCIERGQNYPRGVDPDVEDANSGFALVGDVPAQRGVSEADRATLGYLLWRYGDTEDDRTAAAMFLLTHLLSADPDFGSTTLDSTVLGPDWPDPAAVGARAHGLLAEAQARRGPWTVDVTLEPAVDAEARTASVTVDATVTGPGGPIGDVEVTLDVSVAGDGPVTVSVTTDDAGRVSHTVDITEAMARISGDTHATTAPDVTEASEPSSGDAQRVQDAPDVTGTDDGSGDIHPATGAAHVPEADGETLDVVVTAGVAVTPGGYRVFHGRPGTQQVITDAGDGPAIAAAASVTVDVPPPPPPPPPPTTTTTTVPPTTTTVAPTTTTTPPSSTSPPTTATPTTVSVRPTPRPPIAHPRLPETGGGTSLAPVALTTLTAGIILVLAARWMTTVRLVRNRRGGAHLRRRAG